MAYRRRTYGRRRRPSFRRRRPMGNKRRSKKSFGRTKRRSNLNARVNTQKIMAVSYDLSMEPTIVSSDTNFAYQAYIQWRPCVGQALVQPKIAMVNNSTTNAQTFGTLPNSEATNFSAIYAKTKLSKVVIKYMPCITQGMAGTTLNLAANNNMYTIPIYDNVDDIVSTGGICNQSVALATFQNTIIKPYTKVHSIYKPWTRIIKPKCFLTTPGYEVADTTHLFKKDMYLDFDNVESRLNGLLITMPPLSAGGFLPSATPDTYLPVFGTNVVKLGRIQMIYYQKFKTRV